MKMQLDWRPLLLLQTLVDFVLAQASETGSGLSSAECVSKGFTAGLLCSACAELPTFGLSNLTDDCASCCVPDSGEPVNKVGAFVKSPAVANWPGLEVKYARGADPAIKLIDADGEVKETLNIEAWNTDSIVEFLEERLEK